MVISQRCEVNHFWATVGLYSGKVTFQRCLLVFVGEKGNGQKDGVFPKRTFLISVQSIDRLQLLPIVARMDVDQLLIRRSFDATVCRGPIKT